MSVEIAAVVVAAVGIIVFLVLRRLRNRDAGPVLGIAEITRQEHKSVLPVELFQVEIWNSGTVDAQVERANLSVLLAGGALDQWHESRGMIDGKLIAPGDDVAMIFKLESSDWKAIQTGIWGPLKVVLAIQYRTHDGKRHREFRAARRFEYERNAFVVDGTDTNEKIR